MRAELLPEEKVQDIESLQRAGRTVCMAGDGVNDAPTLKTADVGDAMPTVRGDDLPGQSREPGRTSPSHRTFRKPSQGGDRGFESRTVYSPERYWFSREPDPGTLMLGFSALREEQVPLAVRALSKAWL